ncbi:hypothetical protein [Flavihumibacter sp. CACIAM 22H1]|uniref:hypothetical protein n=1 Tax=Flavihumibacter sp. CACIAM 22H1 TaxID=1812911 RepID=UPI0007A8A8FD|nr:hypothetical protein [Flavihumibacter sp. CACIAM 22H1]KYP13624.1 MAG: hypothetical protein A1D16_08505 [Flavihumibacter sp. CACIAM 22H1]
MKYRFIIWCCIFFICFAIKGCEPIKTKLSDGELKWINIYRAGDSLIFKSQNGEFDTSFIVKSLVYYPEYIPIEVHNKYLPQEGVVLYKNKNLKYHSDSSQLVHIAKEYPNKETRLFIQYLSSQVIILDLTNGTVEKMKKGKIYEFDTFDPKSKATDPKKIFWHEDYGVIKYITHEDVIWERVNLSNLD